jgi:hypothetical protein
VQRAAMAGPAAAVAGEDVASRGAVRLVDPALLTRALAAGAVVAAVMATARLLEAGGERTTALLQLGVGGIAGLAVYLGLMRLLGLGDPRRLLHPGTVPDA